MKKWTRYMLLMPVLLAQALCSCSLIDEAPPGASNVSLAFNISTNRYTTRMSEAITQQTGQQYRGVQNLRLFPFANQGTIGTDNEPLLGLEYEMEQNEVIETNYFDNHSVKVPDKTASFLCYAQAVPEEGKFANGSIIATGLVYETLNTSSIAFAPEVIHNDVTIVENDKPSKIAAYLTEIANAIKTAGKDSLFRVFVNTGHPIASSSTNAAKLAAWASSQEGITIPNAPDGITNYPSDINLPDGAAVVKWQKPQGESEYRFVPQPVTTTEANVNRLDRFIYPAELWYYANSRIKTSASSQKDHYSESWESVLSYYDAGDGIMNASVRSVAIKNPLSYAVGCLQVGLVANNILTDANEDNPNTITLSSSTFPLTAIFVSGQHAQAFNFTPKDDNTEYIIYDKVITGISMGDARTATPSTATPSKYTNTLVLQSQDGKSVRFALEFENNSGKNFWGINGIVFAGTKFYLVGTIKVPTGQTEDYRKRAFTKAYTTQGTVTISSLKQAYTYLPDLLDPRLEIGIELVPDWIQSTTTNVPL